MLNKISPFFAVLFSAFLLKETVTARKLLVIAGAFCGCILIIKPSAGNLLLVPSLIALFGGITSGISYSCLRGATKYNAEKPAIVFWFSLVSTLAILPFAAARFVVPSPRQLVCLLLCGLFSAGGQFAVTAAYAYAPAKDIAIYSFSQILFSAPLGFLLFDQVPDMLSILGYAVIILFAFIDYRFDSKYPESGA